MTNVPRTVPARRPLVAVALLALASMLTARAARATTIVLRTLPQLSSDADRITHGRIAGVRSYADQRGMIWTSYTLDAMEDLKGSPTQQQGSFQVLQAGGTVGTRHVEAAGFPHFVNNEEVILFTRQREVGRAIVNAWQGALRVRASGENREVPDAPMLLGVTTTSLDEVKALIRAASRENMP